MSATISSMCRVARGMTSGVVMRRVAASARNASRCRAASASMVSSRRRRAADDLVVDVGDVHHPGHGVTRASAGGGRAGRRTGRSGSCRCAPARRRSDRTCRPRSRPGRSGSNGRVSPDNVSCSRTRHGRASMLAIATAEIDRPAPSAPSRLPLDALTLTAPDSRPSSPAIGSAHRVEVVAEPRSRRDDRHVHPGRPPARFLHPTTCLGEQQSRWRCPAGSARRRGRDDRDRRGPPRRGARRRSRGGRRRRPSARRRRGAPAISTPPRTSGAPGPNGWLSWPIPVRVERCTGERRGRAARGRPGTSP